MRMVCLPEHQPHSVHNPGHLGPVSSGDFKNEVSHRIEFKGLLMFTLKTLPREPIGPKTLPLKMCFITLQSNWVSSMAPMKF